MSKKILLIGGAGFIGHNLSLNLIKHGHKIKIIDSLKINNIKSQEFIDLENNHILKKILKERFELLDENKIDFQELDARNYHDLHQCFNDYKPDVVIQLAAISHANKSNKDPHSTFDHSLRTLENALDASKNRSVEHFIYFSSSMVYGNFIKQDIDEDTVCNPLGIYGTLKYAGEKIVKAYKDVFNLDFTIIRPSALYGERCVSRRVTQLFLENIFSKNEITVHGDGNEKLDFTYIDDLCQGVIKIIENQNSKNQIFNITYGQGRSITELTKILKTTFPSLKIQYKERDKLMPIRGSLSIEKAKKLLDYQPHFRLEEGYMRYIEWYKEVNNK